MEGGIIFGLTAALYGEITIKDGRVEQSNFDSYQMLRIDEAPVVEVVSDRQHGSARRHRRARDRGDRTGRRQRDFRRDRQAAAPAADR